MNIDLPAEQLAFVRGLVSSGRFSSTDEVIAESVRLLVSNERLREQVQVGVEQADRGELVDHETVFSLLKSMAAPIESDDSQ